MSTTEQQPGTRAYRFGKVLVSIQPELVTVAVPYAASGGLDWLEASLFVERYTHATPGTMLEDDDTEIELHLYANVENLVSGDRVTVPLPDPRRPEHDTLPADRPVTRAAGLLATGAAFALAEPFLTNAFTRAGAALAVAATSYVS